MRDLLEHLKDIRLHINKSKYENYSEMRLKNKNYDYKENFVVNQLKINYPLL